MSWTKRRAAALCLVVSSLVMSVVLAEIFFRVLLGSRFYSTHFLLNDEVSWRLRWVNSRADRPSVYEATDVYDSRRGWTLRPNLRLKPYGGQWTLSSNSRGLRGTEEFPYEKRSRKRILVLGDSFTFGESVSDNETYSHVLATLLPGTEVLNFGVHGYGHDQMLLYFIDEAVKYKPDIVVLGFISIDMDRNIVGFRDYAKPRFVRRGGNLVLTQVPVPRPEEILEAESRRLRTWDFLKVVGSLFYWRLGLASWEKQKLTTALLDELIRKVEETGGEPVLAYMPTPHEYRRREPTSGEQFFAAYVVNRGVRHLNLRPHFERAMDQGVDFGTGHWNATGHGLVAEHLAAYLRR